jgi:chromosome segregation ATPase
MEKSYTLKFFESLQALKAELSEAQANAHIKLNELDHVKSIQCTNDQLITEKAALISRVGELERDLATRDAMVTRYTTRLERLRIKNAELNKSLENSLREIEKGQKSLKDWSSITA